MTQRTVPQAASRRVLGAILAGFVVLGGASAVAANEPSLPLAAEDLGVDGHSGYAERVAPAAPAADRPAAPVGPARTP